MNPYRDEIALVLGGQSYVLRPTFAALAEMEGALGVGLIELCGLISRGKLTLRQLVAVVSAGIKGGGGTVPADLGGLVLAFGFIPVLQLVGSWLTGALSGEAGAADEAADEPGKA